MNPTDEPAHRDDSGPDPAYGSGLPYGSDPAHGQIAPYGWAEPVPPRRPWRRTLAVTGLTAVALAVAGGPLGVLWHVLAPTVPVLNAGQDRIVIRNPAPEEYIASDGWFTLLGFGFGLVAAIVAWLVLRRDRGPWLVLGVTAGSLAAALVAWQAGRLIGAGAYRQWRDTSAVGETYQAPPDLHAYGTLLVAAFAAAIVLTLLAGWSNDPNLDQPGARPGPQHHPADAPPHRPDDAGPVSSGWPDEPDPTAAPAPPGPGPAGPPRG